MVLNARSAQIFTLLFVFFMSINFTEPVPSLNSLDLSNDETRTSGKCPALLYSEHCQCFDHIEDTPTQGKIKGLKVECVGTNSAHLHKDINSLAEKHSVLALQVRDSNLRDLNNLPQGLHEVRHLSLANTGIDLETIRESNENLYLLRSFEVFNEKFTEIPENFFQGMDELRRLVLNDVGIAAISEDAFENLEDSLVELHLRENRLRRIPIAVAALQHLEVLDLLDNDIDTVPDNLTPKLESSLKSLKSLKMNRINCTCTFGRQEFVTWIRSHAIKGVRCTSPDHLHGKDVSTLPTEDFCVESKSYQLLSSSFNVIILILVHQIASHLLYR